MPRTYARAERVGSLIKEEVIAILSRDLKDPRLGFVTVTDVRLSPDLQHATVMVSVLGDDDARRESMRALASAAGFVRRELASRLSLRQTPDLSFREDSSLRDSARIEELLDDWKKEQHAAFAPAVALDPLPAIVDVLQRGRRFALVAHLAPDGDSLGSELALAHILWGMGKEVRPVSHDPLPARYAFLPASDRIEAHRTLDGLDVPGGYDAVLTFECPDVGRTGYPDLGERHFVVNIDHHQDNSNFGAINWVDTASPAVGEMVLRLLRALDGTMTPQIATCLYTAIMTDTGSFTYSNTDAACLRLGAEMVDFGANPHAIAMAVYDSNRFEKLKLLATALDGMLRDGTGRIAYLSVTMKDLAASGASSEETDDLVNYPRSLKGVDVAVLFKEIGVDRYKVSLRSKGDVDVFQVAKLFGGGGHKNASGCSIAGVLDAVRASVLDAVERAIGDSDSRR
ncbi:MAG: 30S ribosome-binding factor RbfA [Acidobacteriota bacterium]